MALIRTRVIRYADWPVSGGKGGEADEAANVVVVVAVVVGPVRSLKSRVGRGRSGRSYCCCWGRLGGHGSSLNLGLCRNTGSGMASGSPVIGCGACAG